MSNVHATEGDFPKGGFAMPPASCDATLLFNILHSEEPFAVLSAAGDVVRSGGMVAVIHWRSDVVTHRGPALVMRPKPEEILEWADAVGGLMAIEPPFLLPALALRRGLAKGRPLNWPWRR